MSNRPPSDARTADFRLAVREANSGLQDFDYIGALDRFRHRESGDLFKARALLNLYWRDIPNRMSEAEALYSTTLGIRQYAALTFLPGGKENVVEEGRLCLNTWQPCSIRPVAGDPSPFLDLVSLIFDGDAVAIEFFLDAIASLIQAPTKKWAFMILLIGGQGLGKSMLCEMVAELVGRRNTAFPTVEAIRGAFTGWLLNAQLVVVHELDQLGREVGARVKHWVTSETLLVNQKNVPEFYIRNYANIIACSNEDDIAHLDDDDRRMFSWISQAQKREPAYYAHLAQWFFEGEGKAQVLHFLQQRDLSRFNPNAAPPRTQGRQCLVENSRTEAERFLREALDGGLPPFLSDLCTAAEVLQFLRAYQIRCTDAEVRRFLRQHGAPLGQVRLLGGRYSLWAVRDPEHWTAAPHEELANAYIPVFDQPAELTRRFEGETRRTAPMPVRSTTRTLP